MKPAVHPADAHLIAPVQRPVFDRGSLVMAGTNVRVGDVVVRFIHGDSIATLAVDFEVGAAAIEAALRTALRVGRRSP